MKYAISIVYFAVTICGRWILRVVGVAPARLVILYYHAVRECDAPSFERQMMALSAFGHVVALDPAGSLAPGRTYNAVSFDDAFASVRDHAVPLLRRLGIPATIFVPSGNLDDRPRWEIERGCADSYERVMSEAELRDIQDELITIGSHTCTHPRLAELDESSIEYEVAGSKAMLEQFLGTPVTMLALPYGNGDARVIALCRKAGYVKVFGIHPQVITASRSEFLVGRVAVDPADGPLTFFLKRHGAYAWMARASAIKRYLISKSQRWN